MTREREWLNAEARRKQYWMWQARECSAGDYPVQTLHILLDAEMDGDATAEGLNAYELAEDLLTDAH